jgi:hypothetical protein
MYFSHLQKSLFQPQIGQPTREKRAAALQSYGWTMTVGPSSLGVTHILQTAVADGGGRCLIVLAAVYC